MNKANINQLAKPVNKEQDEIEDVTEDEEDIDLSAGSGKRAQHEGPGPDDTNLHSEKSIEEKESPH